MAENRRYQQAIDVVVKRLMIELAEHALDGHALSDLLDPQLVPDEARVEAVDQLRAKLHEDRRATHDGYNAACEYLRRTEAAS